MAPPRRLVLLLLAATAFADVVHVKGAKKLVGRVVSDDGPVVVNAYNSTHPAMTLGVERVPKDRVRKIVRTIPEPVHEFEARLAAAEDPGTLVALAAWCDDNRLKERRLWALERALRLDPGQEEARKQLGRRAPDGNWKEQVALARRLLDAPAQERAENRPGRDFFFDELYLRRARRSKRQPKGQQDDRAVALRADELEPGARYTLFVPDKYDPLVPVPLVIGLHGGGRGGADGKRVVGAGWQAMSFYRRECDKRGWICACPTALAAGWGGSKNDDLIDAVIDEVCALYNVDETRLYLVGHSMGGGGAWVQASRTPERWAAVAPAASYGPRGIAELLDAGAGLYVYHSDDDPRTPVGPVRAAMKPLAGSGEDFVYTELPGRGHSFPREVIADIFSYFAVHRRAGRRGRPEVRPLSSFRRKLSRDERKYLPLAEWDEEGEGAGEGESLRGLLRRLETGGGVAEQAVPRLAELDDERTGPAVARVMLRSTSQPDVRAACARILGARKEEAGALGRLLGIEEDSAALVAALEALEEIGDRDAGPDVLRFLDRRRDYLFRRASSGRVDHADWIAIVPPMANACRVASLLEAPGAADAIAKHVLEGIFLADVRVVYDRQNQNPLPVAQALANAACATLRSLKDPAARGALEKMRKEARGAIGATVERLRGPVAEISGWPGDPRIAAEVRSALSEIPTGG